MSDTRYAEFRNLLWQGVSVNAALQSAKISNVVAAQRWAYRNKDLWLIAKLKSAYNIEKAIQERKRYHAKKVKANA